MSGLSLDELANVPIREGESHNDLITAIPRNNPPIVADGDKTMGGFVAKVTKIPKFSDFVKDLNRRQIFTASRQNGDKTRRVCCEGGGCCVELQ